MANVKMTCGRFACIPDNDGKLLLVQRGLGDGRWNLPGGGVDEKDAEKSFVSEQIITREVREETDLDVVQADPRPIGEYPTAKHTDLAITYFYRVLFGSKPRVTVEGVKFKYVTPSEAFEMARKGDVVDGLVGGIRTSTGGVPRHIQMVLHYFTRANPGGDNSIAYREEAKTYCKVLGISE